MLPESPPQAWLTALAALAFAATTSPAHPRVIALGSGIGALLLVTTALAMFPDPTPFARVIGCVD